MWLLQEPKKQARQDFSATPWISALNEHYIEREFGHPDSLSKALTNSLDRIYKVLTVVVCWLTSGLKPPRRQQHKKVFAGDDSPQSSKRFLLVLFTTDRLIDT